MYCIVLYYIVLYCIVLYCIVLYCIVLYCIVLYCIVLYCIALPALSFNSLTTGASHYGKPEWYQFNFTKYHATFIISFSLIKYIVQLSKYGATFRTISCNSGNMYIFGNMYNGLGKVMGVVPGRALLVGKVASK